MTDSTIATALERLAAVAPTRARPLVEAILDELSVEELAAIAYDWRGLWARPKQLLPEDDAWRSCGFLTARAFGKTRAIAEWLQGEVLAGRAMRIALMAQNEDKTIEVMCEGESGLIATSPPWFKCQWSKGHLLWPNGAQAFVYTPEAPQAVHGPEHHAAWVSEVTRWPASTRDKAFHDLQFGLRLGYGRLVWDSTPIRRHPMVRYLLQRADKKPRRHRVVRGTTYDNRDNITPAQLEEWEDEYGGTQRGREQLYGEFLDDSDGALWRQLWIDRARRNMPAKLRRRVLSVDPAISTRKGTDCTGIADLGLGIDDQVYVIADLTGKHPWEQWGALVVHEYLDKHCDCVVVERNRGGDAVVANLRAAAKDRGIAVQVVGDKAPTRHRQNTIYVKEVLARRSKDSRAEPVATLYEKGRVSHVIGSDLEDLEDVLTTWEPTPQHKSPDGLDAVVHGVWELARLGEAGVDHRAGFTGLGAVAKELKAPLVQSPGRTSMSIADSLGKSEWGSKL